MLLSSLYNTCRVFRFVIYSQCSRCSIFSNIFLDLSRTCDCYSLIWQTPILIRLNWLLRAQQELSLFYFPRSLELASLLIFQSAHVSRASFVLPWQPTVLFTWFEMSNTFVPQVDISFNNIRSRYSLTGGCLATLWKQSLQNVAKEATFRKQRKVFFAKLISRPSLNSILPLLSLKMNLWQKLIAFVVKFYDLFLFHWRTHFSLTHAYVQVKVNVRLTFSHVSARCIT